MDVNTILKYTKENKTISVICNALEIVRRTLIILLVWSLLNSIAIGYLFINQPTKEVNDIPPANMELKIPPILEVEMPE